MNKSRLNLLLLMYAVFLPVYLPGQVLSNVRAVQNDEVLDIYFDFDAPPGKTYFIAALIRLKDGQTIVPRSLYGTNLEVRSGRDRIIRWNVLKDVPSLQTEIAIELRVPQHPEKGTPPPLVSTEGGGVSNAFLSMVLPGLGDVFVNDPGKEVKVKPGYIMTAYVTSVVLALYSHQQLRENYNAYLKSVKQYEMNAYYDRAVYYRDNARFFTVMAGLIWISDVVRVAINGAQNNSSKVLPAEARIQFKVTMMNDTPALGLAYKF